MGYRLSKIYTRTGDKGTTGLGDGSRVNKDHARIEAIGCIDELNSLLGVLLCQPLSDSEQALLTRIQHRLFDLGGELSIPGHSAITPQRVEELEQALDAINQDLPPLQEFILPGGSATAAHCHHARAVCRRAERRLTTLATLDGETVGEQALRYLNRLSDLLFVLARALARRDGGQEIYWSKEV